MVHNHNHHHHAGTCLSDLHGACLQLDRCQLTPPLDISSSTSCRAQAHRERRLAQQDAKRQKLRQDLERKEQEGEKARSEEEQARARLKVCRLTACRAHHTHSCPADVAAAVRHSHSQDLRGLRGNVDNTLESSDVHAPVA